MAESGSNTATSARGRLLDAGVRLLAEMDVEALERWMTATDVSEAAALSRRTFYDQFATVADYVRALSVHLAEVDEPGGAQNHSGVLDAAEGDVRLALSALRESGRQRRGADHRDRAALVLRLLGNRRGQSAGPPKAWVQFVRSLGQVGQLPRGPLTVIDVAAALVAVVDAFSLNPSDSSEDVVVETLIGVVSAMTVGLGHDGEQLGSALLERRIATAWRERINDQPVINLQRLVLQAASEEIIANGLSRLTLPALHHRTGLSESTIAKYVGNTRDIASVLLAEVYPGLAIALDQDVNRAAAPDVALKSHVARMVRLCRVRPDIAEIELASRFAPQGRRDSIPRTVTTLDELLLEVVLLLAPRADDEIARSLVGVVQQLICTLARTATQLSPERCAEMVVAVVDTVE